MQFLKQSTAVTIGFGPIVDETTGLPLTDVVIQKADLRLKKNGGNMAAASADQGASNAGAPHDELGVYDVSLDATDTNTAGRLEIYHIETGVTLPWKQEFMVLSAAAYDALTAGQAQPAPRELTSTGTPTTTEVQCSSTGLPTQADAFADQFLVPTSGTYRDVARRITDYVVSGGTATFTIEALPGAMTVGDKFIVVGKVE